ncbi:hypothetical protein HOO65_080446 [Ceratocystis lukuohia]|uniref:Uncharacterized protein n=2 Tax=Ceratocystis TaxID=5157 RepID=A0A2C5XIU1_9PEZI|nr:hypothetical protein CFIMG_002670RA [Ceratocystis fimbriata CBS 114723]
MGFFSADAASVVTSRSSRRRKVHSSSHGHSHRHRRSRSSSSDRSRSRGPASIVGSFFNMATGNNSRSHSHWASNNNSKSSFFGASRPSYYKRSPRAGFMTRAYKHLKRIIRDILHWVKRHPIKVFMLVIIPLITSGALVALLARFGLRIPAKLEHWLRTGARAASGDTFGAVGEAMRMTSGGSSNHAATAAAATTAAIGGMGLGMSNNHGFYKSSGSSSTHSVADGYAGRSSSSSEPSLWNTAVNFFRD